jgi:PAS domain S-box-containing protein
VSLLKRLNNTKLILSFTGLTVALTWVVIFAYGHFLRQPFYAWVERSWPNNLGLQDQIEQSVEHFFISAMVDAVVVSLLLRLINRKQRDLRDSEERYRALFEHASDGIGLVMAADHLLVEVNKRFSEILGYDQQALIGTHVCELFEKHDHSSAAGPPAAVAFHSEIDRLDHDRPSWARGGEINIQKASGALLVVSVSCSAISTGREKLFMLIIRDQTEHVLLEREKQEMQRQLFQTSKLASIGELSAGVAHEINNPLNAMINFAQLLRDDGLAHNTIEQRMLDGIIEEGNRIAKIVRDLLTFARQDPYMPAVVAIAPLVENSVSLFGHQLEKDDISVEIDIADAILPVRADASRLRQVIVNMISNAHHALSAKDSVTKHFRISARNQERAGKKMVCLEFYDNGVGISRQTIEKVFDPFFTSRRDSGGTGLGLSLSFGIIQSFDGKITVDSDEGRFTRFVVELPAATEWRDEHGDGLVSGRRAEHSLDDGGVAQTTGLRNTDSLRL